MAVNSAKELTVYLRAYELAMLVFELSKRFPAEERYALTSQIRRSSRSICMNLREAWAKRRYPAAFIAKLLTAMEKTAKPILLSISHSTVATSPTRSMINCHA